MAPCQQRCQTYKSSFSVHKIATKGRRVFLLQVKLTHLTWIGPTTFGMLPLKGGQWRLLNGAPIFNNHNRIQKFTVGKHLQRNFLHERYVAPPNCQQKTIPLKKTTETETNWTENPFTNDLFGGFRRINGLVLGRATGRWNRWIIQLSQ